MRVGGCANRTVTTALSPSGEARQPFERNRANTSAGRFGNCRRRRRNSRAGNRDDGSVSRGGAQAAGVHNPVDRKRNLCKSPAWRSVHAGIAPLRNEIVPPRGASRRYNLCGAGTTARGRRCKAILYQPTECGAVLTRAGACTTRERVILARGAPLQRERSRDNSLTRQYRPKRGRSRRDGRRHRIAEGSQEFLCLARVVGQASQVKRSP